MSRRVPTTWTDLLRRLTANGKIEQALLINSAGEILCHSADLCLTPGEISGVLCTFSGHYYSLMRLNINGRTYTCFRNSECHNSVIGRCEDRILVMQRYNDMVILGTSQTGTPGSCLYELSHFAERMMKRSIQCIQAAAT